MWNKFAAGSSGTGALPAIPGMKKKRGRPSKADLAAREAYAAQLEAQQAAAAARATATSPEARSPASHNRQVALVIPFGLLLMLLLSTRIFDECYSILSYAYSETILAGMQ